MRQLCKPALLAASYKGNAAGIASAALEEIEGTLVACLHELQRLASISGGDPAYPLCLSLFLVKADSTIQIMTKPCTKSEAGPTQSMSL